VSESDAELRRQVIRTVFLPMAVERTRRSLDTAKALHSAGFLSPAFVWAVRSGEIFFCEGLLFPIEYEASGDVEDAFRRVRDAFRGGKWGAAEKRIRAAYGLTDEDHLAETTSGEDALVYWGREGVGRRGEVVHGREEITEPEFVEWAIGFVERMQQWWTLRAIASSDGPLGNTLRDIIENARGAYEAASAGPVDDAV